MNLTSFIVMDVLEKAMDMERSGQKIVHMEVGEPDFPIPEKVKEAAEKAIRDNLNSYSPSFGIWELREAIANYYWENFKAKVNPDRIFITPGSSPALMAVIKMLSEEHGKRVVYTDPGYPCYKNMARFLGLDEAPIPVYEENGFKIEPDSLKGNGVLVLNTPSNPIGTVLSRKELERIVERALSEGMGIVCDEIYQGIEYTDKATTILEVYDRAIVANGFSKFFAATGWRLGWVIVPEEKIRLFQCIAQNLFICAPTPLQYAAVECFTPEALRTYREYVERYRERRDYLIPNLKRLGFGITHTPEGAFYIFAKVDGFTHDSFEFAMKALEEAKVAITPGKDFGNNLTEKYVRFSYATSLEDIKLGIERLEEWLKSR